MPRNVLPQVGEQQLAGHFQHTKSKLHFCILVNAVMHLEYWVRDLEHTKTVPTFLLRTSFKVKTLQLCRRANRDFHLTAKFISAVIALFFFSTSRLTATLPSHLYTHQNHFVLSSTPQSVFSFSSHCYHTAKDKQTHFACSSLVLPVSNCCIVWTHITSNTLMRTG